MNNKQTFAWTGVVILSFVGLLPVIEESSAADEPKERKPVPIQWRTDYNEARKESEAKKLPLVIVFYRPDNPPSIYVFRKWENHRALAIYLSENAVPLKLDGKIESYLRPALNITLFPTTIIAMPDGKIAETLVGLHEPEKLLESVKKATRK